MSATYVAKRRIAFHETDAAGVAHFSRLLCLVEEAEHEYLLQRGISVFAADGGWPRAHLEVDYSAPVHAGDELSIELSLLAVGEKSVKWGFSANSGGRVVMKGSYVVVRVGRDGQSAIISAEERACLISGFSKD